MVSIMGFKTKCKGPQWHSFSLKSLIEKGNRFIQIPVGYKKKIPPAQPGASTKQLDAAVT